jgi:hypothetical protein
MTPTAIIRRAAELGLSIQPDGENLRVRGPREAIAEIAPAIAANKPEILRVLGGGEAANDVVPGDLERLIQRAGICYEYGPEDFDLMRDMARRDPAGLRRALESDPWLAVWQHD